MSKNDFDMFIKIWHSQNEDQGKEKYKAGCEFSNNDEQFLSSNAQER